MFACLHKNMKTKNGFTIIELIVVIAIIAVLAAIVLVNVSSYTRKSKFARFQEETHQMSIAITAFYDKYGKWPIYVGDFLPPTGDGGEKFVPNFYPTWDGSYWRKSPDGLNYQYYYDDWSGDGTCAFLAVYDGNYYYGEYNVNCIGCQDQCGVYNDGGL